MATVAFMYITAITPPPLPTTTELMSAWGTVVAAGAAVLTVGVAIVAALYAKRQWLEAKGARKDAADGEVERLQPQVLVYLEPNERNAEHTMLVVKNFGATAATNVVITLDEPIRRDLVDHPFETVEIPEFPFFPPGYEWRTWLDKTAGRSKTNLPMRYDGEVRYQGLNGAWRRHPVVLDTAPMKARVYMVEKGVTDVVKSLDKISQTLKDSMRRRRSEPKQFRDPALEGFAVPASEQPELPSTPNPTSGSRRVRS